MPSRPPLSFPPGSSLLRDPADTPDRLPDRRAAARTLTRIGGPPSLDSVLKHAGWTEPLYALNHTLWLAESRPAGRFPHLERFRAISGIAWTQKISKGARTNNSLARF